MSMDVINGYICHNCTDIDYAKKNIDPTHPKDGPYGANKSEAAGHGPAVVLSGALGKAAPTAASPPVDGATRNDPTSAAASVPPGTGVTPSSYTAGSTVDISA